MGRALGLVWSAARREVAITVALQVVGAVALAAQLLVARSFLAAVVRGRVTGADLGDVLPQLLALGLATVVSGFVTTAARERQRLLGELTARHVQARLLEAATAVDLEAFETPTFHDQLLRATVNAEIRPLQMVSGLLEMTSGLVGVVAVAAALASIEPLVVPLVLLAFVPVWVVATRNSHALYELSVALTPGDRERAYLQQLLTGKDEAKELRAYQVEGFLRRRFEQLYDERIARLRRLVALRQRRALMATGAVSVVTLGAVAGLVQLTLSGRISVASAGAAALGVQQLTSRLRGVFNGASSLYECSLFLEDVTSFVDRAPAVRAAAPARVPFHDVRAEGLWFTYPGTDAPVLRGIDLELNRGEVVALVGENGSGKTTLVKLLCGLYTPTDGRIVWGGTELSDLGAAVARSQIAVIFQDFLRYQLSAAANIGIGRHDESSDGERVRAAALAAGADRFLSRLDHGYETLLTRAFLGGAELSLGQWQRVALARALFRDAPFVILDEPTAFLDAKAEHELFDQARQLFENRAVLLISHRFSSVRQADRIYVLDDGAVVESGDHDSLVKAGGHYSKLFELQAAGYRP